MAKPRVYITREVNDESMNLLKQTCDVSVWSGSAPVSKAELMKNLKDSQALFCTLSDKIDKEILDVATNLKVIATMSVGYDHLDVAEIKAKGIRIGYTPDVLTDATAELTVGLLLATSRRLFEANEAAKTGGWSSWSPFWMCGPGLSQSTVGVVGFGRIGQEVAKCLKPFNLKRLIYYNRSERKEAKEIGADKVDFNELLTESDFIVVTCALTPETKNLFNQEAFKKMKKSAVFVNTSRGGVVDQPALVEALQTGEIWGAGLDVMTPEPLPLDDPLLKLKNCVILPHIGSASIQTRNKMGLMTAQNIVAVFKNEEMPAELIV